MRMWRWMTVGAVLTCGCEEFEGGEGPPGGTDFDPPAVPAHTDSEDGFLHARGKSTPFLCKSSSGATVTCPTDRRPADEQLSCDAAGCHGDTEYFANESRHLLGSDGPSCYTCHDQEWSDRVTGGGQ